MRPRFAVLVACALAWGCRREPPPPPAPMPAVRVIDALAPRTGIAQGADVTFGRDTRRTVMLPASTLAVAALERDAPQPHYRFTLLPEVANGWRRVDVVRTIQVGTAKVTLPPMPLDLAAGTATIPVAPSETPTPTIAMMLHAAARSHSRGVETAPFVVGRDAELVFDAGVHTIGTRVAARIGARVSVVEGDRATAVWRETLPGSQQAWSPARVSLAAFAGRRVRLRFTSRPDAQGRAAGMLAVFGEPVVLASAPRPPAFANVVLLSMDTLRAKSVGAYGCARPTTPTLDALAASGVLFENAFSTAAFTLPGHLSMVSGLWFRTHGALGITASLAPERRTLAEWLQSAGYATAAFTSGAWIVPWAGFRRGFDVYSEQPAGDVDKQPVPYLGFTRALDWMTENRERPFFVFLHNYLVHMPYLPPPPYRSLFGPLPPDARDDARALLAYEQEVRYGDDQVRALLEGIAALGVADRTLVVVTADHGEQFREHGSSEHTYDVYDEIVRIPLIMRLPGAIPAGMRVAEPASLADVAPTIVDLLGLPPIPGADGTSLLPLASGAVGRLPRDGVFSEAESRPNLGWVDLVAAHTRTVSCIHDARAGTDECWDRRVDPWQLHPPLPANDGSPEVADAKSALARFLAGGPRPTVGPPMFGPPAADAPATPKPAPGVEAERREQLRALGYVE